MISNCLFRMKWLLKGVIKSYLKQVMCRMSTKNRLQKRIFHGYHGIHKYSLIYSFMEVTEEIHAKEEGIS